MTPLFAMIRARMLEILRDRAALTWNLVFAPMLVIGVAMFVSNEPQKVLKVGVLGDVPALTASNPFLKTDAVDFLPQPDLDKAIDKVKRHSLDLLVDLNTQPVHYWMNDDSAKGRLVQSLLKAQAPDAELQTVTGSQIRYADWLVPGLLGVNIMFSCLFSMCHVIIKYRMSGYLKRLKGTPLRAIEFLAAQLVACTVLIVLVAAIIFTACRILLHLRMEGSYLDLLAVVTLGAMSIMSMSLVLSVRSASQELANGMLNLISWPMMIMSGVFFSLDGAPAFIQKLAAFFPLTHMLTAARAVMLDGAGLHDIAYPVTAMVGMICVYLAVGAGLFRWTLD